MTAVALAFGLVAPFGLGVAGCRLLGVWRLGDRWARTAWAWLVGCLLLGALVQGLIELHVPPAWWWPVVGLVAIGAFAVARRRPGPPPPPTGRAFALFVLAGIAVCAWFALAGMDRPCVEGDEGNIWSLKAKSLLVDFPANFASAQVWNLHPDYPQLDPLLQAWMHALLGAPPFEQFANRWPIQLCDVALFVATAAALHRRARTLLACLLAALLLGEPVFHELLRTAYADGMVALGLVVALDGFLRWRDGDGEACRRLAGLGFAFALWSKNETMLYLASFLGALVIAAVARRRLRPAASLWALLPAFAVGAYTALWNRRFGMKSDLLGANPTGKSLFALMAEQWRERVPALGQELWRTLLSLDHAHAAFAAVLVGAVLAPRLRLPAAALLASLVGLHVVYVGSFLPLRFHLDTSYLRVTFQLLPAALVLLAAMGRDIAAGAGRRHTAGAA